MKDYVPWIRHDADACNDRKVMLLIDNLGFEGYGIYWFLVETLRREKNFSFPVGMLPILARQSGARGAKAETFEAVVLNYGLFETVSEKGEEMFFSPSLTRRMANYNELCEKRRASGAAGGRKKAQNDLAKSHQTSTKPLPNANQMPSKCLPNAYQTSTKCLPSRVERSIVEKSIEERSIEETMRKDEVHLSLNNTDTTNSSIKKPSRIENAKKSRLPAAYFSSEFREEAERFAVWFRDKLAPGNVPVTEKTLEDWAYTWYLLRAADKRQNVRDMCDAITWARQDPFWSRCFLTPMKLRTKDKNGVMYIDRFLALKSKNGSKNGHQSEDYSWLMQWIADNPNLK